MSGDLVLREEVRYRGALLGTLTVRAFNYDTAAEIKAAGGDPADGEIAGVKAVFEATSRDTAALDAAARRLGAHHFNFYQVCIHDTHPPGDATGRALSVPYVDPPPGGYAPSGQGCQDGQWSDRVPWYFDETWPPPGYGGGGFMASQQLSDKGRKLTFVDEPAFNPGQELAFQCWLVAVKEDHTLRRWLPGFAWRSDSTGKGAGQVTLERALHRPPARRHYRDLVHGETAAAWFWLPTTPT